MKLIALASWIAACTAAAETQPPLQQVQSVYILPMASGMDQYLANKITREGLFLVVTDPQRADALLTDRIGEPFERKFEELYPQPKKLEPKPEKKDADSDKKDNDTNPPVIQPSTFGRGKGTIFLVDRKSRAVIWSTYDRPHSMRADSLDKTADQIVNRMKRDRSRPLEPRP